MGPGVYPRPMGTSHQLRSRGPVLAAALLLAALQLLTASNLRLVELDPEEGFNAAQGWLLLQGHWESLFQMQYRTYCGGCTLEAVAGLPLLATLGRGWITWKLVPVGVSVACLLLGWRLLRRGQGPAAAGAFLLLLLLPPRTWQALSVVSWANHYEAGVWALLPALLLLPGGSRLRAGLAGVALGVGVYLSFSGAFAVLGLGGWLLLRRRWRDLGLVLLCLPLGLTPWLAQWTLAAQHPFHTIYAEHESLPMLSRVPAKLATVLAPRQLQHLFGLPTSPVGLILGVGTALSAGIAGVIVARRRAATGLLALCLLLSWLAVYSLVGFSVRAPAWPELPWPGALRYAAAAYPALFLLLAAGAGLLWSEGRRLLAGLLLAAPLCSGLLGRVEVLGGAHPTAALARVDAVDWGVVRAQLSYAMPLEVHRACTAVDRRCREVHAYALGRADGEALLHGGRPQHAPEAGAHPAYAAGLAGSLHVGLGPAEAGSLGLLDEAASLLAPLSLSPEQASRALRELASLRLHHAQTWRQDAGPGALGASGGSVAAREAAWWAVGRDQGLREAILVRPGPVTWRLDPEAPASAAEGFGHGLGEKWGPLDALPPVVDLSDHLEAAVLRGHAEGLAARFR